MKTITINTIPGYDEWRATARDCLAANIPPEHIVWKTGDNTQNDLFSVPEQSLKKTQLNERNEGHELSIVNQCLKNHLRVPKSALELFESALCHSDPDRFSLCYRILWRLIRGNKNLLKLKTDPDIMRLTALVKAVRRDAYKMSAYLRFREVDHNGTEHFIAWYEPEHYSLELKLHFFKTRFKNMRWSILTPYRAAHWDTKTLLLEDNPDPSAYPKKDRIEQYWLTYYANIFNPARPKKGAMLSAMPKKYWKNMPETVLIDDLLKTSETRARKMITTEKS